MMSIRTQVFSMSLALLMPTVVCAQQPAPLPQEVGADTRHWIDLQARTGISPAPPRPMSGEVADQVYQRYLKSFSHPIPDQFDRQNFIQGGQGGGAGQ